MCGGEFDINSNPQLREVLFERLAPVPRDDDRSVDGRERGARRSRARARRSTDGVS